MFLYTICPACQTGYDLPDLMRGKKLRCKSCASPFAVVASPRPKHWPPLVPFAKSDAAAAALPSAASVSAEMGTAPEPQTYLNQPGVNLDRPLVRHDARAYDPPARSGGWWGKGGGGAGIGLVILISVLVRGCAALSRTSSPPPVHYNPPPVQWQQPPPEFKFNPPGGNQGPNNRNNPGGQPKDAPARPGEGDGRGIR